MREHIIAHMMWQVRMLWLAGSPLLAESVQAAQQGTWG